MKQAWEKEKRNQKPKAKNNNDATRPRLPTPHQPNHLLSHLKDINENIREKLSHVLDDPPHRNSLVLVLKSEVKLHRDVVEEPPRQLERRGLKDILKVF